MKKKKASVLTAAKAIMLLLTLVYPLAMVILAGSGLIYNGDSYGKAIVTLGVFMIISGILMTTGAVLCLFKKKLLNILSLICTGTGLPLCLVMLYKLCDHAKRAGWADNFTMEPVSDMYISRLLPAAIPAAIAVIIAVIQIKKEKS